MRKILGVLLSMCMLFTTVSLPVSAENGQVTTDDSVTATVKEEIAVNKTTETGSAESGEAEDGGTEEVSRLEWLTALTTTFGMSVEKDNYPDNYFSDIDSTHEKYYEIMLATEFGLVDVEAGDEFKPDDAATREFAAHTLNQCLGYTLEKDAEYTFAEKDSVTYPMDIQVAINRGWFELSESAFLPQQALTETEKEVMLTDAAEILASVKIDEDYKNQFLFADDVIVLPEGTDVTLTDENELTIKDCDVELKAGDIFGFVQNELPIARKVVSVTTGEKQMVVKVASVETEEAFKEVDVQGSIEVDLAQTQALSEDVELVYIVGGTLENNWQDGVAYDSLEAVGDRKISAVLATQNFDIPDAVKKEFDLADGVTASIDCTISNVTADKKISFTEAYYKVNADVTFTSNVSVDVLEAMGVAPSLELARVPVGIVGYMTAELEMSYEGSVTLTLVENVSAGVHFADGHFRLVSDFKKKSFTIQAQATVSAGVKLTAGFDIVVLKGSIYGRLGATADFETTIFDDGKTPNRCSHMKAWMYATIGADVAVNLGIWKEDWATSYAIFTEMNSPVRVSFHYEDGVAVNACTRDGVEDDSSAGETTEVKYKYYTPINSSYGYSGSNTGVDASGNTYQMFNYKLDADGNATITKYNGNVSALNIPSVLDGNPVVGIASGVFKNNTKLRVVVVPEGVTAIGYEAFSNCSNLTSVKLPSSLKRLSDGTNHYSSNYSGTFYNCVSLNSVNIPKDLEYASYAFAGCKNLENVEFESGIETIVSRLFAQSGIKQMVLPNTVTAIKGEAFASCRKMESIIIPDSVVTISAKALFNCDALTKVEIPAYVTSIGESAFESCENLEEVIIGDGVVSMADFVFKNCTALKKVKLSDSQAVFYWSTFENCTALEEVTLPGKMRACETTYYTPSTGVFGYCDNLKVVKFGKNTTIIPAQIFWGCKGIEEINIPDTVTTISGGAFLECTMLSKVTIPESVTTIGGGAFKGTALKEVIIPSKAVNLGTNIFGSSKSLEKATILAPITEVPSFIFNDCISLTSVVLPETIEAINPNAFSNTKLTEMVLPDSVTELGVKAFNGCSSLKKVILSEELLIIDNDAFKDCTALEELVWNEKVSTIGSYAFQNCDSLTSVKMPDSVLYCYKNAFENCDKLKEVYIGRGIKTIFDYSFRQCSALEKVVIANGVTTINNYAFTECISLTEVTIPPTVTSIGTNVFSYPGKMTIYGVAGSYAETYANEIGATFVNKEVPATSVSFNVDKLAINKGATAKLTLSVAPEDCTDIPSWISTNESVVTVTADGTVTANAVGTAVIKAYVGDMTAICEVTVNQPITSLSLNKSSLTLEALATYTLTARISPTNATNKEILWSSADEKVAKVDENGLVLAVGKGSTTIKAEAKDGSGRYATCTVNVTNDAYVCTDVAQMESPHNYKNSTTDIWFYQLEGAESLNITFDAQTSLEEGCDYLYVYDSQGQQVGKYSGKELAGQTITVEGDSVKLKLVTNVGGTDWGFKVTKIEEPKETIVFEDVEADAYYETPVQWAVEKGITNGYGSNTTFCPDLVCTRGQIVTFLWRAKGCPEPASLENPFIDVATDAYYYKAVLWAVEQGITNGYGSANTFCPDGECTRGQVATFMWRAEGKPANSGSNPFVDLDESAYYYDAVLWAVEKGVTNGYGSAETFCPDRSCTRGQIVTFLYRGMN